MDFKVSPIKKIIDSKKVCRFKKVQEFKKIRERFKFLGVPNRTFFMANYVHRG